MKDFNSFVNSNQKGKLHIETDDSEFNENWAFSINVSKIWQDYANKSISIIDFNNEYASLLMEKQQAISTNIGDACWNEVEPVIVDELRKAIDEETSETVYNKLYDIFDRYEVFIDTGKINQEMNEIPTNV